MIFGIGIDDIEVERIRAQIDKEGGIKDRLFTAREIAYCESKKYSARHYAARFAAKEAFFKALGTGWRDGMKFSEVEIVNDELGKPQLLLHGRARAIADKNGIVSFHVSLSHIEKIASAVVALEK